MKLSETSRKFLWNSGRENGWTSKEVTDLHLIYYPN